MRGTETEIPDQSDAIPPAVAGVKGKKISVQRLIDDLPPCSTAYTPIAVEYRAPMPHASLKLKPQTPLSLFLLFISSAMLEIIAKHINLKADLERSHDFEYQRS